MFLAKFPVFIAIAVLCAGVFSTSCFLFKQHKNQPQQHPEKYTQEIPKANLDLKQPIKFSTNPEDVSLCDGIKQTIENNEFKNARWGLLAVSMKDGRAVCGIEAQRVFIPASIQKLLTSIVALDKLGEDFRWETKVYSQSGIRNGILEGDIVLYGGGAPDLDDQYLEALVSQLKNKGLKSVKGDVIGDESFFKGDNLGEGWTWNEAQWYYGAAASALSINENRVIVSLKDGKPKADSRFVEVSGEVTPIDDIEAIGVKRELGTNNIYVWGSGKKLDVKIAISKPALLAAKIFKEKLEKSGIKVEGEAKSADWRSPDRLDTGGAKELAFVKSQNLAKIVKKMNKDSVNLYAELILRTLGKKFGDEAPDENPKMQKLRGDDSAGASYIKKWLEDEGVAAGEITVHDGSGLSRLDYVTPESIVRALVYATQSKFADTFNSSLPVAGKSGTLHGRLKNVSGQILAKTGSIRYVDSLAGYARSPDETFAFAIICNNQTHKADSSKITDKIASMLVK